MGIDWKRKLSSRKFWAAVAGWIGAMYVLVTTPVSQEKIVALVTATGILCCYIFGESKSDAAHAGYIYDTPAEDPEDPDEDEEDDGVAF